MITNFKLKRIFILLFGLLALVIIADFAIPSKTHIEEAVAVKRTKERYNNAAQNSHYSYKIHTATRIFSASKDFAIQLNENQKVQTKISLLFNEVNSAKIAQTGETEVYSLRLQSGLVFPLLALIVLGFGYKQPHKRTILLFVVQALLLADLVFLLL